jgi:hypothetical protein
MWNAIGWDPVKQEWEDGFGDRAPPPVNGAGLSRPEEYHVTDESEAEEVRNMLYIGGAVVVLTLVLYRTSFFSAKP